MTLDAKTLAELKQLDNDAQPPLWHVGKSATCPHRRYHEQPLYNIWQGEGVDVTDPCAHLGPNEAALIAAARNALPALLEAVALLREFAGDEPLDKCDSEEVYCVHCGNCFDLDAGEGQHSNDCPWLRARALLGLEVAK